MKKKAQAWGFDLLIGTVLFIGVMVIFYIYSFNYPREAQKNLETLQYEADFVSEIILSEQKIVGILTDNKINESKLSTLYDLANFQANQSGYELSKQIYNTKYDYFFNLSVPIIIQGNSIPEQGIGKSLQGKNPKNLVKTARFTIYMEEPVTLNLYVWE